MTRRNLLPAITLFLAGCLAPEIDAAQNRCLQYGFHGQNALAHCTEIESKYPASDSLSFGRVNTAQDQCLSLGYTGNALADCAQRHVRGFGPGNYVP